MNPLPRLQAAHGMRVHAHELEARMQEPRAEDRINIHTIRGLIGNGQFYPGPIRAGLPKPSV